MNHDEARLLAERVALLTGEDRREMYKLLQSPDIGVTHEEEEE